MYLFGIEPGLDNFEIIIFVIDNQGTRSSATRSFRTGTRSSATLSFRTFVEKVKTVDP